MLLEMSVVIAGVVKGKIGLIDLSVDLLHALMSDTTPRYTGEDGLTDHIRREARNQHEVRALQSEALRGSSNF